MLFAPLAVLALCTACGNDPESAAEVDAAGSSDGQMAEIMSSSFPTTPLIDPNGVPESVLAGIQGLSDNAIAAVVAGRPFATPSELHAAIGEM